MSAVPLTSAARNHSKNFFSGILKQNLRFQCRPCLVSVQRCLSLSTRNLTSLEVEKRSGYGIITMNRKPVNALNTEMLTELCNAVKELESDKNCQGLILTSALPKIFSAGLDITAFLGNRETLENFWYMFQETWLTLYGSRLAAIAAINGAAPAGGLLLAASCDYRIMRDGYVIGPNETLLGIVAPPWFQDVLINTVGLRNTELLLNLGKLIKTKEALDIGLIDAIVEDNVVEAAEKEIKKWLAIPATARQTTKLMLRAPTLDKLRKARQEDSKAFLDYCMKESTQKVIAGYLESLGKK